MQFVATAARGTEDVLREELEGLGLPSLTVKGGSVRFEGPLESAYRALLWSRVASRVLVALKDGPVRDAEELYALVKGVDWTKHFGVDRTFAVQVVGRGPESLNPRFAVLKAKDAVADAFWDKFDRRPDVDKAEPDVRVHVHLAEDHGEVSLDLSGRGLYRRGTGRAGAMAPLRENLAAALLYMTGWPKVCHRGVPLVDPMCGSGTLLIEAAAMALRIAPGLSRDGHGFERLSLHEPLTWARLCQEAEATHRACRKSVDAGELTIGPIVGRDHFPAALEAAQRNAAATGVQRFIRFEQGDLGSVSSPIAIDSADEEEGPLRALLVTNPPYGERIGEAGELGPLYEQLGDVLKQRFGGYKAYVLSGNPALVKRIGLKPSRRIPVFNGNIDCRFLSYAMRAPKRDVSREGEAGPGWRKPSAESEMFHNRLRKNWKKWRKWAKQSGISCFRLYDADIPEFNVAVDYYDGAVRVQEYRRPTAVDAGLAERRLRDVMAWVPEVLEVDPSLVSLRVRSRRTRSTLHGKRAETGVFRTVQEGGLSFLVNMDDYLDTGLFLDHRDVRAMIREESDGRDVLNLYAYTCSASVYAAAGGARSVTSVDLSQTYLDWGVRNFEANKIDPRRHRFIRDDCAAFLRHDRRQYDLIFVAPPTFSVSRRTQDDFDLQRDHVPMLRAALGLLRPSGHLLFSSPTRRFEFDERAFAHLGVEDLSAHTVPLDFQRNPQVHRTWRLSK